MNAVVSVVYAPVAGFPPGSAVSTIEVEVGGPGSPAIQSVPPDTASVTFADLPTGDYTFRVAAKDSAGNILGTPVTGTFTLTEAGTISLSLPASATVAQA